MDDRPVLRALVIRPLADGGCHLGKLGIVMLNGEREVLGGIVTLETEEDVERLRGLGLQIYVDPADESALARWYQIHSPRQPWEKW